MFIPLFLQPHLCVEGGVVHGAWESAAVGTLRAARPNLGDLVTPPASTHHLLHTYRYLHHLHILHRLYMKRIE